MNTVGRSVKHPLEVWWRKQEFLSLHVLVLPLPSCLIFPSPDPTGLSLFLGFSHLLFIFVISLLLCELPTRFHSTCARRIAKCNGHLYIFLSHLSIKLDRLKFTFLKHKPFPFWFQLLQRDDWLLLTLLLTVISCLVGQNQTFNCQDIRCHSGSLWVNNSIWNK